MKKIKLTTVLSVMACTIGVSRVSQAIQTQPDKARTATESHAYGSRAAEPQNVQNTEDESLKTKVLGVSGIEKGTLFESTTLVFGPGQAMLSDEDKNRMRNVIKRVHDQGKVSQVKVAVWSDKMHPNKGDLPKADQNLANQRTKQIEKFLKDEMDISRVKAFNMAENRNWLGKVFHYEESKLESALAKPDASQVTNNEFRTIKEEGGPSKAVVIVEHEMQIGG